MSIFRVPHDVGSPNQSAHKVRIRRISGMHPQPTLMSGSLLILDKI